MAVFPALYFSFATKHPSSGSRMEMSRSYVYTTESDAPDQRAFVLTLTGMQYFLTTGGAIDLTPSPERNMAVLEAFYVTHRLAKSFDFDHPVYGTLTCKFNKPLEIPDGIPGGNGVLEAFSVELIEIP